ncbi:thiazole biosynthesis adenylyltransferase ThiF [Virgibacillus alimentarius]|uniref:Molybdopterin/thiamine biosynthesis adenylyltransferase n=1 Tax=Virgibacillus alimentarius TaxID=698769 RepID=A0ABS4S5R7_9BACI|nr:MULTISPECIES: thiazole biosynthesis adenylyltransferase ThiF [Virgibacillus]MBP2256843.1 molybdopterin/thiamine biosynthesis adenylyltransferase [Virgibacillus alimentarius]HLR69525.1 thiazole biosynthesis adenylyltransferase ThiF [Virgibacillus sp.]
MNDRYSRQTLFAPIGEKGQRRLKKKHVLLVGAGALGTGNAESLVRGGVGKITIVDRDYVEWSNLQRQQLFVESDAIERIPKAIAAKKRLQQVNSEVEIEAHILDVGPQEFESLIENVDLIIDATDNFDIRMIINDISQKYGVPWIYGSCVGSYGISFTIIPNQTPCLHCLMETVPIGGLTCDTAGIISPAANMVVVYQTAEALKILTEDWGARREKLVSFDLWKNEESKINVSSLRKADCTSCGVHPTYPFLDYENQTKSAVLCGRDSVQIRPAKKEKRDLETIAQTLSSMGKVEQNPFLLSFTVEKKRLVLFQDGRTLIHGTKNISEAKTLYHRYLG